MKVLPVAIMLHGNTFILIMDVFCEQSEICCEITSKKCFKSVQAKSYA